jgi:hypothetical protein
MNAPLLQPERGPDETLEAYKERRTNAKNYVESTAGGTLSWNTREQCTYVNRKKVHQGKAGHRAAKLERRLLREQTQKASELGAQEAAHQQAMVPQEVTVAQ